MNIDFDELNFPLNIYFPDDLKPDEYGLVALGGELFPMIIVEAYSKGIFPWTGEKPIPWYSPDPRLVLYPEKLYISKSLNKIIKKNNYTVKYDNDFTNVMNECAAVKRKNQDGTWITDNMRVTYKELFDLNIAHCVEVFYENELAGGLYGLSLGKTFFGESMFHKKTNFSKIALFYLVKKLKELGITMIDCQQSTPHMRSMGAEEITRENFVTKVKKSLINGIYINKW